MKKRETPKVISEMPLLLAMATLPAAAGPWVCDEKTDRMDGSVSRSWLVDSTNREAVMPWSTPTTARLVVGASYTIVVIPDDGIVDCPSKVNCAGRLNIDGKMVAAKFGAPLLPVMDIEIDPQRLAQAHQVKVEVPVFQSRPAVFTFDLPGQAPASCPLL